MADESAMTPPAERLVQERHGVVWRAGLRVTTRCVLAGADKTEHEAGQHGRVWAVLDDGVLVVALDDEGCEMRTVKAEPEDLEAGDYLAKDTRVKTLKMKLTRADGEVLHIPHGTSGTVLKYNEKSNAYTVKFSGSVCVTAEAPSNLLVPLKAKSFVQRARGLSTLMKQKCSLPLRTRSKTTVTVAAQRPDHLSKQPEYSNLSSSPRSARRAKQSSFLTASAANASTSLSTVSWANHESDDSDDLEEMALGESVSSVNVGTPLVGPCSSPTLVTHPGAQ